MCLSPQNDNTAAPLLTSVTEGLTVTVTESFYCSYIFVVVYILGSDFYILRLALLCGLIFGSDFYFNVTLVSFKGQLAYFSSLYSVLFNLPCVLNLEFRVLRHLQGFYVWLICAFCALFLFLLHLSSSYCLWSLFVISDSQLFPVLLFPQPHCLDCVQLCLAFLSCLSLPALPMCINNSVFVLTSPCVFFL